MNTSETFTVYQFLYLFTLGVQIIVTLALAMLVWKQSYFAKKGQNQADKEDIADLTRLVEGVKTDFIRENAKVFADLDMLKDRSGKNYTQAQQSIINFHKDFDNSINAISELSLKHLKKSNFNEFEPKAIHLEFLKNKSIASYNLMDLLVDDSNCIELGGALLLEANPILVNFFSTFDSIKKIFDEIDKVDNSFEEMFNQGLQQEEIEHHIDGWIKHLNQEKDSAVAIFLINQSELLINLQPYQIKFRQRAKQFLLQS